MYTRSSITPLPVAPCAERLIQTANKTEIQTKSSVDRITISLSPAHQRKRKLTSSHQNPSTSYSLHEAYTNHWTKLMRAETKRKKEFNLEGWKKETSNTISFKKDNEKTEKYSTNEGKN